MGLLVVARSYQWSMITGHWTRQFSSHLPAGRDSLVHQYNSAAVLALDRYSGRFPESLPFIKARSYKGTA